MKIYTKTGDDGTTGLFNGTRLPKTDLRIETYGTVDELNSVVGLAVVSDLPEELKNDLEEINKILFILGSDLATPMDTDSKVEPPRISQIHIEKLEELIDSYTEKLPKLNNFILPGGTKASAQLHVARAVCRRAERKAAALSEKENIGGYALIFLNSLSDYLFTAARMANFLAGEADVIWKNE